MGEPISVRVAVPRETENAFRRGIAIGFAAWGVTMQLGLLGANAGDGTTASVILFVGAAIVWFMPDRPKAD
jgi:hypothetical protein